MAEGSGAFRKGDGGRLKFWFSLVYAEKGMSPNFIVRIAPPPLRLPKKFSGEKN